MDKPTLLRGHPQLSKSLICKELAPRMRQALNAANGLRRSPEGKGA